MVKSTDLRINNLIDVLNEEGKLVPDGYNWKVKVISDDHVELFKAMHGRVTVPYERLSPITLTEEWGDKTADRKELSHYRYGARLIVNRDGRFYDYGADLEIKYLQQLQNLIFVLEGKELTIKETV